jgi:hypothetical protein
MTHQNTISFKKCYKLADDQGAVILTCLMIVLMIIICLYSQEAAGLTHTEQITPSNYQ